MDISLLNIGATPASFHIRVQLWLSRIDSHFLPCWPAVLFAVHDVRVVTGVPSSFSDDLKMSLMTELALMPVVQVQTSQLNIFFASFLGIFFLILSI